MHDLGVIFLVTVLPVPCVEASASTTFRSKYQRALVGAAGVAFELFIAAIAFYLWMLAEPGVFRAVLFNVMVIAGVSTLIFNGNPLLRFDAYYILADLIEIPNLAARSARYWAYLLERYVLGAKELDPPDATPRAEKAWFRCLWRPVVRLSGHRHRLHRVVHRWPVLLHRRHPGAVGCRRHGGAAGHPLRSGM